MMCDPCGVLYTRRRITDRLCCLLAFIYLFVFVFCFFAFFGRDMRVGPFCHVGKSTSSLQLVWWRTTSFVFSSVILT